MCNTNYIFSTHMYVILDTASVKISFTQNSVQIFDAILRSLYTSFVLSSSLTLNSVLLWVRLTWISLHNILCGYYTNCVKMLHKIACYFECNINTTYVHNTFCNVRWKTRIKTISCSQPHQQCQLLIHISAK